MKDFLTACALALVIEGVVYALFPGAARRLLAMPPNALRLTGIAIAAAGVAGVWLVRSAMITP
ncbi:MAG TPA: DUF2065 domain-containing protein [Magnetospirillum sp.]|nr:DUF2065 domain-containing protein [Magnetospirillum sp.]